MPDIFVSPSDQPVSTSSIEEEKTPLMKQAFSAFLLKPKGIRFESQTEKETISLLLRKHIVTNIPWILLTIFLFFIPVILFSAAVGADILPEEISITSWIGLLLIWYLLTATYALVQFLLWYFSVSIVTNQRIIDIDFSSILYKEFSATTIGKIEDVTEKRGGFFGVLFDYGDVMIQTAGAQEVFEFLSIPHPDQVVRIVNTLMEQRRERE